jgi:ElaB/YqjD/DUF883 family membrane-anchored ribosome-binding protein
VPRRRQNLPTNGNHAVKGDKTMHHDIRDSGEKIAADFQALLGDAEGLLRALSGASGEAMEAARGRIEERVESLRREVNQRQASALKQAKHAAASADRYVHDNPWPVIGAALAAGVIVGILARRGLDTRGLMH